MEQVAVATTQPAKKAAERIEASPMPDMAEHLGKIMAGHRRLGATVEHRVYPQMYTNMADTPMNMSISQPTFSWSENPATVYSCMANTLKR